MKKALSFIFIFWFISTSMAQHRQKFGLTIGPNYSKFRGMDASGVDYSYVPSVSLGLVYEYYFTERLSIKANLLFENKKSQAEGDFQLRNEVDNSNLNFTETVTYSYKYITLPVMVQYDFKNGKGFFVHGGIFMGYLLDSEMKGEANISSMPSVTDFVNSTTEYNNKFDFGFVAGVGKAFTLNKKSSLVLELRNSHGIFQTNKNNTFNGNIVRSNSYAFLLGWMYDL
ncbi:MAG: PorT family protein [Bacteroidetes bacterium]|nr:PorT family protein [Bacteroidota bacterium]